MEAGPDLLNTIFSLSSFFFLSVSSLHIALAGVFIVLLLVCSAMISSSEVAYFSLSPNDLEELKSEQSSNSKRIIKLLETPRTLLATILISNNFINIAIVIISDYVLRNIFTLVICEHWAGQLLNTCSFLPWTVGSIAQGINLLITVVAVTFCLVLFGEVAPKVYAKINNVRLSRFMARPLGILQKIFYPISKILVNWSDTLEKRLSRRNVSNATSKTDLDEAINLTVTDGINAGGEIDILKSIIHFGDVSVKQIMRARVDVVAIDFQTNYKELLALVNASNYSRIPAYQEDLDHITGLLYAKDLLGHLNEPENFEWHQLLRTDMLYVPEAKKIDDLLKEFQEKRMHMAIVVDEFGGTAGIVTLEDIMEEIIGEIRDEFDDQLEVDFQKIDDYNYIFEGKTLLNDVCKVVGFDANVFDEDRGDADSLAGLVLEKRGRLPKIGTEVHLEYCCLKSVAVSKKRIEQIQIVLPK